MESTLTKKEVEMMMINFVPKRYLNQKEACQYTGVSAGTINKWVDEGLKQMIYEENSNPKYDIRDIDEFLEKRKTKGVYS